MGRLETVYAQLPTFLQHCAATGFGVYRKWLRFGPGYSESVHRYRERERYTAEHWAAWQRRHLTEFLQRAANNVPYYRETWTSGQKAAANNGRLDELPFLLKDPIRESPERFLRDDVKPGHVSVFHTSGSSGVPIATYWTVREIRDSRALREVRSANWAGVSFKLPRATFSGRIVVPDSESRGPYHRFNLAERQVYFSAFHLGPDTASAYLEALRHHGIQWLTGYAVSYYLLARHILDQGLHLPPLKAVVTTSEKLTPEMRQVMEKGYRCKIFEEYSTVENAVFASECEHGRLHVSTDAGIVEILRPDGTACGPGEVGEVVTTSFVRRYQPFIRYRLGDMAAWSADPCPCGRSLPVLQEVVGRIEDVVVGPDGRQMVRFHGVFVGQSHVVEGQIVQEALDRIRAVVVPTAEFGQPDVRDIQQRIKQRLGDVEVVVERVSEIPRTRAGKFKAVVSHLSTDSTTQGVSDP
jgi:phenylacetate-CoA ligase